MHFNFIGHKKLSETVSGIASRGRKAGRHKKATSDADPESGAPAAPSDDWSHLEELSAKRRMTILTEELERQTRAQSQFEESFYKMAVRLQSSDDMSKPERVRGATKRNLLLRRLETERKRLTDLSIDMDEVIERLKLIEMHMKVIRFRPSEEALQTSRDEAVVGVSQFIERAERCLTYAGDLARAIDAQMAAIKAAVQAARGGNRD